MQHRQDGVRPIACQNGDQVGVDVADIHLDAHVPQGLGHASTRAQRYVALVGEPAGEHGHTIEVAHTCS